MPAALPRVVLDTNVVISAFWGGIPGKTLQAWFEERYIFLISPPILSEYQAVLKRLLPDSAETPRFLHAVYLKAVAVQPPNRLNVIQQDPADNRLLECAQAGKADYIVSGDQHLLRLKSFDRVRILTPRAFLEILR